MKELKKYSLDSSRVRSENSESQNFRMFQDDGDYGPVSLPEIEIWPSGHGSSSDSDSWSDPWGSYPSDPWGGSDPGINPGTGGNTGGGGTGSHGGGNGGGFTPGGNSGGNENNIDFPVPKKIDNGAGVRIYVERFRKDEYSTLSRFIISVYDKNGNLSMQNSLKGYFLERAINYDQAEVSGSNTAIKMGDYEIVAGVVGQKFKWYLQNVPGRYGIAIHAGNSARDSSGCLLPGNSYVYGYDKKFKATTYMVEKSSVTLSNISQIFNTYGHDNIRIIISENF